MRTYRWEALETVLVGLDKLLVDAEDIHRCFTKLAFKLITPCATAISWESLPDDGHLSKLLRGTMVRLQCRFAWKTEEVQAEAKRRFEGHLADPEAGALPSEYATPVYAVSLTRSLLLM
jgi:ERAP1-like C-terminal domain